MAKAQDDFCGSEGNKPTELKQGQVMGGLNIKAEMDLACIEPKHVGMLLFRSNLGDNTKKWPRGKD